MNKNKKINKQEKYFVLNDAGYNYYTSTPAYVSKLRMSKILTKVVTALMSVFAVIFLIFICFAGAGGGSSTADKATQLPQWLIILYIVMGSILGALLILSSIIGFIIAALDIKDIYKISDEFKKQQSKNLLKTQKEKEAHEKQKILEIVNGLKAIQLLTSTKTSDKLKKDTLNDKNIRDQILNTINYIKEIK